MEEKKVPNENNDAHGYCRRCFVVIVFMKGGKTQCQTLNYYQESKKNLVLCLGEESSGRRTYATNMTKATVSELELGQERTPEVRVGRGTYLQRLLTVNTRRTLVAAITAIATQANSAYAYAPSNGGKM